MLSDIYTSFKTIISTIPSPHRSIVLDDYTATLKDLDIGSFYRISHLDDMINDIIDETVIYIILLTVSTCQLIAKYISNHKDKNHHVIFSNKIVLICFVGPITYGEIAVLRKLENILILCMTIVNGNTLIQSFDTIKNV